MKEIVWQCWEPTPYIRKHNILLQSEQAYIDIAIKYDYIMQLYS